MEQHTFENVNNYLNTNNYSYLETSGVQSYYTYLNVVHFFNTSVNEECHAAKGKQACSCFEAQLKFVNFLILQQKCHST
jgi:hypothetical protein